MINGVGLNIPIMKTGASMIIKAWKSLWDVKSKHIDYVIRNRGAEIVKNKELIIREFKKPKYGYWP